MQTHFYFGPSNEEWITKMQTASKTLMQTRPKQWRWQTADETERKTRKGEDEAVKATELPAGPLQTPHPTDSHCHASITHVLLTHHSLLMKTDGDFQISTNRMKKSEAIVATVIITVIHERHRHL